MGKVIIAIYQAWWSLDNQMVEYWEVELQIAQILYFVLFKYQQAHFLLYDKLMFGARNLTPIKSWRLKNNLDLNDFGGS